MAPLSVSRIAKEDAVLKSLMTDLSGGFREIIFPSSVLPELVRVGIAYDGSSFHGINDINQSDAILVGDPETLVKVPDTIADTNKPEYWIICNIHGIDRKPHPNCSRSKLIELQDQLAKRWDGGNMMMGAEPEAYFVEQRESIGTTDGGNVNYFNPKDPKSFIITEISQVLDAMGFQIERAHSEVGEEQFEINWRFDRAERTADRVQMFKLAAHKVARNYGFDVTFLPKPYPMRNGSGMHCHVSVMNGKKNLFYDSKETAHRNFSKPAQHFLAGILKNARSLAAISNPAEVSYSRLVPGFEAPCIIAIGSFNRSAACRVPIIADPKILSQAIRVEFRFPDPLANPYLLAAGFISAGILGLEKKEKFPGFCDENLYALEPAEIRKKHYELLPRTLWEAYKEFMDNKDLAQKLGKSIHETYGDLLLEEIDACQPFANPESAKRHYFD